MKLSVVLASLCGLLLVATLAASALIPNGRWNLVVLSLNLLLLVLFVVTFAGGVIRWKRSSAAAMIPAMLCVAIWLVVVFCGKVGLFESLSHRRFRNHVNQYEDVVRSLQNGLVAVDTKFSIAPIENLPAYTKFVRAARCADGSIIVEFVDSGGSFAGHTGYLFTKSTSDDSCITRAVKIDRRWRLHHMTGNWYRFD
jgi:hypothetical protein